MTWVSADENRFVNLDTVVALQVVQVGSVWVIKTYAPNTGTLNGTYPTQADAVAAAKDLTGVVDVSEVLD